MDISGLNNISQKAAEYKSLTETAKPEKNLKGQQADTKNIKTAPAELGKDILLQTLDKLENSMQVDDSHPLGRLESAPIETYEEALMELSLIKEPGFKEHLADAQANISPESVLSLFVAEEI